MIALVSSCLDCCYWFLTGIANFENSQTIQKHLFRVIINMLKYDSDLCSSAIALDSFMQSTSFKLRHMLYKTLNFGN